MGADTASVYVSVDDVDGLHDRAKAAGGKITKAPFDTDYGSRDFAMKDPEERVWYFGGKLNRDAAMLCCLLAVKLSSLQDVLYNSG